MYSRLFRGFIVILPSSKQTPFSLAIQMFFLWFLYTTAWVPFKVTELALLEKVVWITKVGGSVGSKVGKPFVESAQSTNTVETLIYFVHRTQTISATQVKAGSKKPVKKRKKKRAAN